MWNHRGEREGEEEKRPRERADPGTRAASRLSIALIRWESLILEKGHVATPRAVIHC